MSEYYAALVRRYIYAVWHPGSTTIPKMKEMEKTLLAANSLASSPPINIVVTATSAGASSAA